MSKKAEMVQIISNGISNVCYSNNLQATEELMDLFDKLKEKLHRKLNTADEYIKMYDDHFYTFQSWDALVESEKSQSDGLTEEELKQELEDTEHGSVWKLPCGWYVQYV